MEDLFKIIVVLCLDTLALLIGFMWIHTIGIGGSATLEYSVIFMIKRYIIKSDICWDSSIVLIIINYFFF